MELDDPNELVLFAVEPSGIWSHSYGDKVRCTKTVKDNGTMVSEARSYVTVKPKKWGVAGDCNLYMVKQAL